MWREVLKRRLLTMITRKGESFLLGDNREGEIPDPIPNSEVKTFIANGTARKSAGE